MKIYLIVLLALSIFAFRDLSKASGKHDHASAEKSQPEGANEEDGHEHGEEDAHEHGEEAEDEHGEEENAQVGPNKGIIAASEEQGIQLSPEAEKNFEIQKIAVTSVSRFEIPKKALVTAGLEVNLYRIRNGFFKRIDFEVLSRTTEKVMVRSKDLTVGDEIAISGLGFLRIAEIAAFGGAPEGHSH